MRREGANVALHARGGRGGHTARRVAASAPEMRQNAAREHCTFDRMTESRRAARPRRRGF